MQIHVANGSINIKLRTPSRVPLDNVSSLCVHCSQPFGSYLCGIMGVPSIEAEEAAAPCFQNESMCTWIITRQSPPPCYWPHTCHICGQAEREMAWEQSYRSNRL